jgi:hypothetical protein
VHIIDDCKCKDCNSVDARVQQVPGVGLTECVGENEGSLHAVEPPMQCRAL